MIYEIARAVVFVWAAGIVLNLAIAGLFRYFKTPSGGVTLETARCETRETLPEATK